MKKLIKICLYLSVFSFIIGCYKDKGNYDYIELNHIVIDTSNSAIQGSYTVSWGDVLEIEPKIYYNGEQVSHTDQVKDQLSFTWVIYQTFSSGGRIYPLDTLSQDIKLNAPITKTSGSWEIKLIVKDLASNTETYSKFRVNISEAIPDGWMVLYERDEHTDVGLIVDERVKSNVLNNKVVLDLLKEANGQSLAGKPVTALFPASSGARDNRIMVISDQDMIGVDKSTFETTLTFDQFFFLSPGVRKVTAFSNNTNKDFIINDNRLHALNLATAPQGRDVGKYGLPIGNEGLNLAPWQPAKYLGTFDGLVYDSNAKRFLKLLTNGSAFTRYTSLPAAVFNPDDVGLDLVTYDWGYGGATPALAHEYLIMKNATNTYLLSGNFNIAADASVPQKKIDMTAYPGISTVNSMTVAVSGQYLLYSNPNNVYLHKFNNSPPTVEELWSAPAGETITNIALLKSSFIAFQLNSSNLFPTVNQYVYFATWDESTQNGKIYSYRIDITNGNIDLSTERVYEGFGKIKQMSYKWNLPGT